MPLAPFSQQCLTQRGTDGTKVNVQTDRYRVPPFTKTLSDTAQSFLKRGNHEEGAATTFTDGNYRANSLCNDSKTTGDVGSTTGGGRDFCWYLLRAPKPKNESSLLCHTLRTQQ